MVRSELVRKVAEANLHLSPLDAEAVVEAILNAITDRLADGHRVELRGFGSFASKVRDGRMGRNPKKRSARAGRCQAGSAVQSLEATF